MPHAGSLIPFFVGRIDHFGRSQKPGSTGNISGAASDDIRKFYIDPVCESAPALHFCCDFFGVERIMHGTDHPFWPMPLGPRMLDQLDLSAGTARRSPTRTRRGYSGSRSQRGGGLSFGAASIRGNGDIVGSR